MDLSELHGFRKRCVHDGIILDHAAWSCLTRVGVFRPSVRIIERDHFAKPNDDRSAWNDARHLFRGAHWSVIVCDVETRNCSSSLVYLTVPTERVELILWPLTFSNNAMIGIYVLLMWYQELYKSIDLGKILSMFFYRYKYCSILDFQYNKLKTWFFYKNNAHSFFKYCSAKSSSFERLLKCMYIGEREIICYFIPFNEILIFRTPVTYVRQHAKVGGFPSRASFEVLFAA